MMRFNTASNLIGYGDFGPRNEVTFAPIGFANIYADTHPVPYPRCRRERRIMETLGRDTMYQRCVKIWGEAPWSGNAGATERWHARFWNMFSYEVPRGPRPDRQRSWHLPRPGYMPAGRRRGIRTCGPRWRPIRA